MQPVAPRPRRPRPLPDAPIAALLERPAELTKGWLLALLEGMRLVEAPQVAVAELADHGPELCEAVVRALADDKELRRLEPGGDAVSLAVRVGQMTGAQDPGAVSRAVDRLRAVVWRALRESSEDPSPEQLFELGERLALVCELVRGAALRSWSRAPAAGPATKDVPDFESELEERIATVRGEGGSLSLLLVELEDAQRLAAAEGDRGAEELFGAFDGVVREIISDQAEVHAEPGRAWLVAAGFDRAAARALGSLLVSALRSAQPWRAGPLSASVGIAVLDEDGEDGAGLRAAAEEARFAAEASGIGVSE